MTALAALLLAACGGTPAQPAAGQHSSSSAATAGSTQATKPSQATSGTSKLTTIKVGAIAPTQVPLLVWYTAIDRGLFAKHGIKVAFTMAKPPAIFSAMETGQLQFSTLPDNTANGAEKGMAMRIVAVASIGLSDDIVTAKGIHSAAGLKGKVFVASDSSLSAPGRAAEDYLASQGVPASALKVTFSSPPGTVTLLRTGKAAGGVVDTPTSIRLRAEGFNVLEKLINYFRTPNSGVGTTLSEIKQHPAIVKGVIQAVLAAAQILKTDRAAALPEIEKRYHLNAADAGSLWNEVHASYTPSGRVPAADFQQMLASDKVDLKLKTMPTASEVSDFSLLPSAGSSAG